MAFGTSTRDLVVKGAPVIPWGLSMMTVMTLLASADVILELEAKTAPYACQGTGDSLLKDVQVHCSRFNTEKVDLL